LAAHRGERLPALFSDLLGRCWARLVGEQPEWLTITRTLHEFAFHPATAHRPRFDPVRVFLDPETAELARRTYDTVAADGGTYQLGQFGPGALPFDLVVPGRGRGTLRVTSEQTTADLRLRPGGSPGEAPLGGPVHSLQELAALVEAQFGTGASLVGKALMGPVLMSREWVMILNETASGYLPRTQRWLTALAREGVDLPVHPMLRVRYHALDALEALDATLQLPPHLAATFGAPQVTAAGFARGWQQAVAQARDTRERLAHSSTEQVLESLAAEEPDRWRPELAAYQSAREDLRAVGLQVQEIAARRAALRTEAERLKDRQLELEQASGRLRREGDQAQRQALQAELAEVCAARREIGRQWHEVRDELQRVSRQERARRARVAIAEGEHRVGRQRLERGRQSLLTEGLVVANARPTAWWFELLRPYGDWWGRVQEKLELYLESFVVE